MEADPPALVLVPKRNFDNLKTRSLEVTAPVVLRWAKQHYAPPKLKPRGTIWLPRNSTRPHSPR
jgi:hypothetical protein